MSIIVYLAFGTIVEGQKKAFAVNRSVRGRDYSENLSTGNAERTIGKDLMQCRACRHAIHKKAKPCPNCGCPNPVEMKLNFLQAGLLFMCLSVFGLFGISCLGILSSNPVESSTASFAPDEHTTAETIAVIDNGSYDTTGSVLIDLKLKRLSKKFPESEDEIADMTVLGRNILAEKGIQMSLVEILTALDRAAPQGTETLGVTYAETLALFVTLRGSE